MKTSSLILRTGKYFRRWVGIGVFLFICALTAVHYANRAADRMGVKVFPLELLPPCQVALLPGVAKKTPRGSANWYFMPRIEAAAKLYHAKKIRHILISGDNSRKDYDEPSDMKEALLAEGVPASAMTLDYAGFRTLDSVVRAKEIFCCRKLVIITQPGHLERALYLAEHTGIDACGFAAAEPEHRWLRRKNRCRERLARVAAWLDLHLLKRSPKFLGKKLPIAGE